MSSVDKRRRWEIMDRLFGWSGSVTAEDVYCEWEKAGIPARSNTESMNLSERYGLTFRQDILKFRQVYLNSGLSGKLFASSDKMEDARRRTYRYSRKGFSIMPLLNSINTKADWAALDKAIAKLRNELPSGIAKRLYFLANSRFETMRGLDRTVEWPDNPGFRGYDMLPELYEYIQCRKPICMEFGMFGEKPMTFILHPYLLKEYGGRWYCLGFREDVQEIWPVCLDRITPGSIMEAGGGFRAYEEIRPGGKVSEYFNNIIGVTKEYNPNTQNNYFVSEKEYKVVLGVQSFSTWMYLTTNPIHRSQQVQTPFDTVKSYGQISINVITNLEMYNTILSLGPGVAVESPSFVRGKIIELIGGMISQYEKGL